MPIENVIDGYVGTCNCKGAAIDILEKEDADNESMIEDPKSVIIMIDAGNALTNKKGVPQFQTNGTIHRNYMKMFADGASKYTKRIYVYPPGKEFWGYSGEGGLAWDEGYESIKLSAHSAGWLVVSAEKLMNQLNCARIDSMHFGGPAQVGNDFYVVYHWENFVTKCIDLVHFLQLDHVITTLTLSSPIGTSLVGRNRPDGSRVGRHRQLSYVASDLTRGRRAREIAPTEIQRLDLATPPDTIDIQSLVELISNNVILFDWSKLDYVMNQCNADHPSYPNKWWVGALLK